MPAWLVPPRCAICGELGPTASALCRGCSDALDDLGAFASAREGLTIAAAHAYDGAARDLVAAIKLRGRATLAAQAAERIAARALPLLKREDSEAALVPVPPDPWRRAQRGFDLPLLLAREVGRLTGAEVSTSLRRRRGRRQVGRPREERLADPPRVRLRGDPPASAILVDDVATTGATLLACAAALTFAGSRIDGALAFAAVT